MDKLQTCPHRLEDLTMWSRRRFLTGGTASLLGLTGGLQALAELSAPDGAVVGRVPDGSMAKGMITPETQEAIDQGLAYLEEKQAFDGSFGTMAHHGSVAITSLAALAMMAGGNQPHCGHYGHVVRRALDFVLGQSGAAGTPGFLYNPNSPSHGPMYSHGFGTLFLAEVYGMVHGKEKRKELHEKLKAAVGVILNSQNMEGGWRYQPRPEDADISVTICQIMALRAAKNAGFSVPKNVVDRCIEYVRHCRNPGGSFRYQTRHPWANAGPYFARTAAGIVALYSAGIYRGREVEEGLDYLMACLRNHTAGRWGDWYYFYGHYYAVQAMWMAGGSYWSEWFPAIRDQLVGAHRRGGGPWVDQICPHYATAMACIILQVPNNYLPILQK
jgi:hypothetical protein